MKVYYLEGERYDGRRFEEIDMAGYVSKDLEEAKDFFLRYDGEDAARVRLMEIEVKEEDYKEEMEWYDGDEKRALEALIGDNYDRADRLDEKVIFDGGSYY